MPSAVRFCGPQWTPMPSRMVATNLECQSICKGAWRAEKTVSATAPAAAWRRPPKAPAPLGVPGQVEQGQDFGQEEHGHADDEDEKGVLGAAEFEERGPGAHGDVGQAGVAL